MWPAATSACRSGAWYATAIRTTAAGDGWLVSHCDAAVGDTWHRRATARAESWLVTSDTHVIHAVTGLGFTIHPTVPRTGGKDIFAPDLGGKVEWTIYVRAFTRDGGSRYGQPIGNFGEVGKGDTGDDDGTGVVHRVRP